MGRLKGQVSESRRDYENKFSGVFAKYHGRLTTARGCLDVMKELVEQGPDILSTSEWDTIETRFHQRAENLPRDKYNAIMNECNELTAPLEKKRWDERAKEIENISDDDSVSYPVEIRVVKMPCFR